MLYPPIITPQPYSKDDWNDWNFRPKSSPSNYGMLNEFEKELIKNIKSNSLQCIANIEYKYFDYVFDYVPGEDAYNIPFESLVAKYCDTNIVKGAILAHPTFSKGLTNIIFTIFTLK